jgi:hypothetical protein
MKKFATKSLRGILLTAGLFFVLGSARADEPSKARYSGTLRASYDYRGMGSDADQDAYAYWHLRGRDMANQHIDIYTSGKLQSDVDGSGSSYSDDPFISLEDTSRQDDVRLLQLYVDWHDVKKTMALRAGRQYVDVADYIQMDGVQAMLFEKQAIGGRVFMGKPVSYYSSTSGDTFGGISLTGKPWEGNRSRATYARYEDDSESANDDHYFFDVRQQLSEQFRARGYLSVMNEDVRMGGADLFFMSYEEKVFDAAFGIRRWGDYDADTRVYSPLVQALGDQEPYTTGYGRLTTQVLPRFFLSPGVYLREPDDSDETNRRYERYDLSLIFEPMDSLSASIALEYWDVEDDDRFYGVSGDVRYRHHKLWEVSAGAAYLDYTYSQFSDFSLTADGGSTIVGEDGTRTEVSPDVFTYFLRGKWNVTDNFALRVSGELEDDSDESDLGYRFRTSVEVKL